ncbi:MAG: CDP-3,6-dideoxy-D-glycero-L-glycero-4-hexulose-4-reductase [Desulfuromonas sp.]|nr:MAG: CDP-3,6-dideoxy-D-glycero-L-glycero-4-hexulose-4-reductase [Desulfuromonas sp.]
MGKIVSVHSFRGGTGKSNVSANLAYSLAEAGKRVCVIDTDIQSPGVHVLLGERTADGATLNDFLWGKSSIQDVSRDVSDRFGLPAGQMYLVPCSMDMSEILQVLKQGYDVDLLNSGFRKIVECLALDYLIIDTHPGLNEETLLSIAISDALLVIMRPDQQDYQGTAVTLDVARRLQVPKLQIVVNKVPSCFEVSQLSEQVVKTYDCPVAAVLPLSEQMVVLGSEKLLTRELPQEGWSQGIRKVAQQLVDL